MPHGMRGWQYKKNTWYPYDFQKQTNQILPKAGKIVLLAFPRMDTSTFGMSPLLSVGYAKHPAGVLSEIYFVRPGHGDDRRDQEPSFWCDCLEDEIIKDGWAFLRGENPYEKKPLPKTEGAAR